MSTRKEKASEARSSRRSAADPKLSITNRNAAGIDVHSREHWVCVPVGSVGKSPPAERAGNIPPNVRSFGACTADLERLADWLLDCKITTVAMESTGVYWIPLFELLERRGFAVILVDPRQTRQVSGRPKSDVRDCQWIQRLHSYGLLSGSFRPDDATCVLRSYLRQRQCLLEDTGRTVQHLQKAMEQMNVKLTEVVSDVVGVTGMNILKAIVRGVRDPQELAKYREENCRNSQAAIALALQGNWREEHLFALRQALRTYEHLRGQQKECDEEIEKCLQAMPDRSEGEELEPSQRRQQKKPNRNQPRFAARELLFRFSGRDLTLIEGIDSSTAMTLLSEIGRDMSKWPTEKHFASWLGLCPQHRGSANKIKYRHVRGGANRAARAFRMAAQGCHNAKNALGAFYRRIRARAGGNKAVIATAHKIARRVYRLLKYGEPYVRQEMAEYEAKYQARVTQGLARKAAELGFKLIPKETGATA